MCVGKPKVPKVPPAPERQAMQAPEQALGNKGLNARRRRGLWASIFTSPQGVSGVPNVTGSGGGLTGG